MHVPGAGAWSALRRAKIRKTTENWLAQHPRKEEQSMRSVSQKRPYPLWWFYVAFLLSAGGLWLEEKW